MAAKFPQRIVLCITDEDYEYLKRKAKNYSLGIASLARMMINQKIKQEKIEASFKEGV